MTQPPFQSSLLASIDGLDHAFEGPSFAHPEELFNCHQVHETTIAEIEAGTQDEYRKIKADGLITGTEKKIGVQTADCIPALFATEEGSRVAAVHAGWRGVLKGILPRAVDAFVRSGATPGSIFVALGPSIGPCCFEVNQEVLEQFVHEWGHLWKHLPPPLYPLSSLQTPSSLQARSQAPVGENNLWINLKIITRWQLTAMGVPDSQIEDLGLCTYCGPGEMASFRRATHEGTAQEKKRQWSWIAKTAR